MNISIKPGDLSNAEDWEELVTIVDGRAEPENHLFVNLERTSQLNLAQFNSLVILYTKLRRAGANLSYGNFNDCVRKFVDKTNFHHVFTS